MEAPTVSAPMNVWILWQTDWMYNPAPFAETRTEEMRAFIERYPLAALVTSGAEGLEATHVPVVMSASENASQGVLRCHLARANPQWKVVESAAPVLLIFRGPEHYITPSWYPSKMDHGKVVPTWNYVAVHVWGKAKLFTEPGEMMRHLKELTAHNEAEFPRPWAVEDAPADYLQTLAKAIVGVEISIDRIEGKWKASQNRSEADRRGVVSGLETSDTPSSHEMAEIVKGFLNRG
jgi:transcriptional regulator